MRKWTLHILAVVSVILCSPSCVIPPDIKPQPESGGELEVLLVTAYPPPPMATLPRPETDGGATGDGGISDLRCEEDFELTVDYRANKLDLYYYWYLDYFNWKTPLANGVIRSSDDGTTERKVPPTRLVWTEVMSHAAEGEYHTLELIISSQQFDRNVSLPTSAHYAYFAWTLKVLDSCRRN